MFSVIIPVYNGERFVDAAIKSVFAQTFSDWELILVNDGSIDNTKEILEQYIGNTQVKVIHQENAGVSAARNKGMRYANRTHIAFLDADDVWKANHLTVMAQMIEQYPDAGFYGTFTETHLVNGDKIERCRFFKDKPETVYMNDFFAAYAKDKTAKMYTMITTCVSKEAAIKAGGFRVGCNTGEDLAFSLIISAYYPVVLTSRITAIYKKKNSVATKDSAFDPEWYFFDEVEKILCDGDIPKEKRKNIKRVMDWFQMRRSRHYIIHGKKRSAISAYRKIGKGADFKTDKLITFILLCMPCFVVKKIFELRWKTTA